MWRKVASNPAYDDVRINLASDMANAGMGPGVQKQLTPRQFGETKPNVPVTVFLLRCWSVWRARQVPAWLADEAHPYRPRELAHQVRTLRSELVRFQAALAPGSPFCGTASAERVARGWAPDLVTHVKARA